MESRCLITQLIDLLRGKAHILTLPHGIGSAAQKVIGGAREKPQADKAEDETMAHPVSGSILSAIEVRSCGTGKSAKPNLESHANGTLGSWGVVVVGQSQKSRDGYIAEDIRD